jgi:transcriptional repressor NrdR
MEALKGLDPVAYVRFASVYRSFREAADFQEVLGEIAGGSEPPAEADTAAPPAQAPEAAGRKH